MSEHQFFDKDFLYQGCQVLTFATPSQYNYRLNDEMCSLLYNILSVTALNLSVEL